MPVELANPYAAPGAWFRGNLHTHTTESDGKREPQAVIDDYAARGYDFLMISDHDRLTDPGRYDAADLQLIPGNEVTAKGPHLLHVQADRVVEPRPDRQQVLLDIAQNPASLAILAHPNWHRTFDHYPQEVLEALRGHVGIEIYNGVIERLPGSALATDRWDMLLGKGHRVWGFAHDDSHRIDDVGLGWNVVRAPSSEPQVLIDAMRRGSFYASTGVTLLDIGVDELTLKATAAQDVRWSVRADFGVQLHRAQGPHLHFELPPDSRATYLRIEAHGDAGGCAWSQPFYVSRGG